MTAAGTLVPERPAPAAHPLPSAPSCSSGSRASTTASGPDPAFLIPESPKEARLNSAASVPPEFVAARNAAGSEALTTYALAQRLAKRREHAGLAPYIADMRRALGRMRRQSPEAVAKREAAKAARAAEKAARAAGRVAKQ